MRNKTQARNMNKSYLLAILLVSGGLNVLFVNCSTRDYNIGADPLSPNAVAASQAPNNLGSNLGGLGNGDSSHPVSSTVGQVDPQSELITNIIEGNSSSPSTSASTTPSTTDSSSNSSSGSNGSSGSSSDGSGVSSPSSSDSGTIAPSSNQNAPASPPANRSPSSDDTNVATSAGDSKGSGPDKDQMGDIEDLRKVLCDVYDGNDVSNSAHDVDYDGKNGGSTFISEADHVHLRGVHGPVTVKASHEMEVSGEHGPITARVHTLRSFDTSNKDDGDKNDDDGEMENEGGHKVAKNHGDKDDKNDHRKKGGLINLSTTTVGSISNIHGSLCLGTAYSGPIKKIKGSAMIIGPKNGRAQIESIDDVGGSLLLVNVHVKSISNIRGHSIKLKNSVVDDIRESKGKVSDLN